MVRKIDPAIVRAAEILVAAGYRWPTDNIEDLLLWIANAQHAADEAAKRTPTADGDDFSLFDFPAAAFVRSCPDGVNPFAAPPFFAKLFYVWRDLRRDEFGVDRNKRSVARRQFDAILEAIQSSVPPVSRGRAQVGQFEQDQRRQIEEEAKRLVPILEEVLEVVDRPATYSNVNSLEDAIHEKVSTGIVSLNLREAESFWGSKKTPIPHARLVAEALWHYRTKRGTPPVFKVARHLAKATLPLLDVSSLIEDVDFDPKPAVITSVSNVNAPIPSSPRKRRPKS